jgi:hypothetical protein
MGKYIKASGMIEVIEMLRWSNHLDKNSTLNLLVRAIEQSPTDTVDAIEAPRWIPVTEMLPEHDLPKDSKSKQIKVLVAYLRNGNWIVRSNMRKKGKWYDEPDRWSWSVSDPITHWMPLPQPPKDGDSE